MSPMPKVCAEYDRTNGALQTIDSTWDEVVCKEQSCTLYACMDFVTHLFSDPWNMAISTHDHLCIST